jgi:ABC-type sugar transport system ATPase subunit
MLDEPTSSMTKPEALRALRHIRTIAGSGVAVTFISHYLDEIFAHCDDLTILRDGAVVWQGQTRDIDLHRAVKLMIGRDLAAAVRTDHAMPGPTTPVLALSDVSVPGHLSGISFSLFPGQIIGITGLAGSGTSDLALCLAGVDELRPSSGQIAISGQTRPLRHPADGIAAGLAVVTSDRLSSGVIRNFSIVDNFVLPNLDQFSGPAGLLDGAALRLETDLAIKRFNVRCSGPDAPLGTLSGGNQQKVVLAKWLQTRPKVLVLDEPTIGVDVGSKDEIRKMIAEAAAQGIAVIVLTTDLADLLETCSRVLVMFRGAIVAEYAGAQMNEANILAAASGNHAQPDTMAMQ